MSKELKEKDVIVCEICGAIIDTDGEAFETPDGVVCEECFNDNYFECDDCGEIFSNNYATETADGSTVCEDCLNENYFFCEKCGEILPYDDAIEIQDTGEFVCEDCADRHYRRCDACGNYFDDYLTYTRDGDEVCESCLDDYFCWCDECEEYVREDDYDWDYECCNRCVEHNHGIIKPYHYHKGDTVLFFGDRKMSILKGFIGIELETEGYDCEEVARKIADIMGDRMYFEEDCSVRGFECISQPHTYEELKYNGKFRELFEVLQAEVYDGSDCGLHVHISRTAFGDTAEEQNENIAKLLMMHVEGVAYNNMLKLSRREEYRANDWARAFSKWVCVSDAMDYANGRGNHGVAINCENRNTVEFRMGCSTTDFDEFIAWVEIIVMLVNRCKNMSFDDAKNFDLWFAEASDSVKAYMESRGVEWCEPFVVTNEYRERVLEKMMDKYNESIVAQGGPPMDYNTMLCVLLNMSKAERRALGYM